MRVFKNGKRFSVEEGTGFFPYPNVNGIYIHCGDNTEDELLKLFTQSDKFDIVPIPSKWRDTFIPAGKYMVVTDPYDAEISSGEHGRIHVFRRNTDPNYGVLVSKYKRRFNQYPDETKRNNKKD